MTSNCVTPQPPHVSLGNDTTLCTDATLVLDAGNNQNATFLWNTLAQTQTITVTSPGKYYVDVTRGNIKVSDTIIISYVSFAPLSISNSYTFCTNTDPAIQLNPVFTQTQYTWQDGSTTLPYTINQPGIYWLERYEYSCKIRDTITVTSNCINIDITIPNVITPNGDGVNDTWSIEHMENFRNTTIVIFNRWGDIVWKASGNTFQWDGTNYRNGNVLPDGTYFYIIDLKNDLQNESLTGYIQIIK